MAFLYLGSLKVFEQIYTNPTLPLQWFSAIFVDVSSLALEQHDMAWITFVWEQQGEMTG